MQLILKVSSDVSQPGYDVIDILDDSVFAGTHVVPPAFYILKVACKKEDVLYLKEPELSQVHINEDGSQSPVELRQRAYTLQGLDIADNNTLLTGKVVSLTLPQISSLAKFKTGLKDG